MKLSRKVNKWLALAIVAVATTASAQPEQWLQYHVTRDGRGYRYLDLTTNPPPNVALPKLNVKQPYFAHWTTPMDSQGRWLCFDRTRKSGPYDRVFVDSTGNGRLDDKAGISASRIDQYYAYFDSVRLTFKGEDGPITYHLVLRFMKFEGNDVRAMAMSGGYYGGMVDLGGKKRHIELIDADVNGTFNDWSPNPRDTDCVLVDGDKVGERFLGRMLEVEGQLFRIEVARDGAFLKAQKAENVVLGQVRVPETISEFIAFGENGHFVRKPVKGEFSLPTGKYRVHGWTINRKDERGASWTLEGSGFDESATFEVTAAKPVALDIGEPMRAVLQTHEMTNEVAFSLRFQGRFNETLDIMKGDPPPKGPVLTLTSLDGTYRYTNSFEFG